MYVIIGLIMKKILLTAVLSAMLLNPVAAQQPRSIELINQYTILIKKNPKDITSLLGRGMLYSQMGLTENAIADLSAALKISPTHPRLLEARALAYQVGGYYNLSIADAFMTLFVDKNSEVGNLLVAQHYTVKKRYKDAVPHLQRLVNLYSSQPNSQQYREYRKMKESVEKLINPIPFISY